MGQLKHGAELEFETLTPQDMGSLSLFAPNLTVFLSPSSNRSAGQAAELRSRA